MKTILLLALAVLAAAGFYLRGQLSAPGPLEAPAAVIIPKGAPSQLAAEKLGAAGVIRSPLWFRLAVRAKRLDKRLRAGEYFFEPKISLDEVIAKLLAGDVVLHKLTLAEGLTTNQMLELIKNEPALEGEITQPAKEGELLPETYTFERGESRDGLIRQARQAMQKIKAEAWAARADGLPLRNAEEMMILASIIEKETGLAEERRLISAVFVNRLRKGMKLQTDPTVIYALTKGKFELQRPLSRKDLAVKDPYNTYQYYGLPPGPICNPGKAAIMAAVNPADSPYLYFVASGNGGHNFAVRLSEHNKNVSAYRRR